MTPNFSKSKKDITKPISGHDSIIILLLFGILFIHIRPWMAAQEYILQNMSNLFWSKLALFALHGGINFAGTFTLKQATIHASALHCVLWQTWTVWTCFTKIIAEQPSLTRYERPMYHIFYHPLILWFFFSIFRDLGLKHGFLLLCIPGIPKRAERSNIVILIFENIAYFNFIR